MDTSWEKPGLELEYLDLQRDICAPQDSSLILLPVALKKEPHAQQMCSRISNNIASFTNKTDLDVILNSLASKSNSISNGCISQISETDYLIIAGVNGKLIGGKYINPTTKTEISYLPWADGRPWGGVHECIFLSVTIQDMGAHVPSVKSIAIQDESCGAFDGGCFVCNSEKPTTKFSIRGLCAGSKQQGNANFTFFRHFVFACCFSVPFYYLIPLVSLKI